MNSLDGVKFFFLLACPFCGLPLPYGALQWCFRRHALFHFNVTVNLDGKRGKVAKVARALP